MQSSQITSKLRQQIDEVIKQKGKDQAIDYLILKIQAMQDLSSISNHDYKKQFDPQMFMPNHSNSPIIKNFQPILDQQYPPDQHQQSASIPQSYLKNSQISLIQNHYQQNDIKKSENISKKMDYKQCCQKVKDNYLQLLREMQITVQIYHQCIQIIINEYTNISKIYAQQKMKRIQSLPLGIFWKQYNKKKGKCKNFDEWTKLAKEELAQKFRTIMKQTEKIVHPKNTYKILFQC